MAKYMLTEVPEKPRAIAYILGFCVVAGVLANCYSSVKHAPPSQYRNVTVDYGKDKPFITVK